MSCHQKIIFLLTPANCYEYLSLGDNMKRCIKCGQVKPVSEFHKNKGHNDGLSSYCKECKKEYYKEYHKEYLQRPEVKQHRKEYKKEYRQRPEVKKQLQKRKKEYRQRPEVKKHRKEYRKEYCQRPEVKKHIRKQRRKYYKTPNGKLAKKKAKSKRRGYKHIPLWDNPFPPEIPIEGHHLLNDFYDENKEEWFVIPLPRVTHQYVSGRAENRKHWRHNAYWIKKIYNLDVKTFLNPDLKNGGAPNFDNTINTLTPNRDNK